MKAAVVTGSQDIDNHIHVNEDWPKPTLATAIDSKTGKLVSQLKDEHLIVRVLACAIAPGDCRLFTGKTDIAQLPKYGRPYVLGSDICGIVTEVDEKNTYFQVGDKIIAVFDEPQPVGMCAEYACVKAKLSEKCPSSIPAIHACTLPASAVAAKNLAEGFVSEGDRVLLLGASGGVGTFISQYIKLQGASFLAATTTQAKLAESLGVDSIIDYRTQNWWELESEFQNQPFDKVIDLVNGINWTQGARSGTKVLPKRVPYVQLIPGVQTDINMTGMGIPKFFGMLISRKFISTFHPNCPKWITPQGLDVQPGRLKGILSDVESGEVRVILDSKGPFEFTSEGVREAMKLQRSTHAHGKVVIEIAKEEA